MPLFEVGLPFTAKCTITNENCGIPEGAHGNITYIDSADFGIYLERHRPGDGFGYLEARISRSMFGSNFQLDHFGGSRSDASSIGNSVAPSKRYPDDFWMYGIHAKR